MGIEEKFDLEIPEGEQEKIKTVGDAIEYIIDNFQSAAKDNPKA
jgi:acyl carrier protein